MAERDILHIDMNAFYCSCHAAADPHRYRGKPTAVAGSPETRHGVVVTASYEARRFGVRATMTVPQAVRVCPSLILIEPDFSLYRAYSRKVMQIVREYTPLVEVFSIDECFADVGGSGQFGSPAEIARTIQRRLQQELGLPCSVGIGSNKFLAKMASDRKKPLGITEIRNAHIRDRLWPLSVDKMLGVGRSTARRLKGMGLSTIGDVAAARPHILERRFGKRGVELWRLANGLDDRPVVPVRPPNKSIGHSITLPQDATDLEEVQTILLNLSDRVGRRLRRHGAAGRAVQVTIRYATRETITRVMTLERPTDVTEDVYAAALALVRAHWQPSRPIRLLGVSVQQLRYPGEAAPVQLPLFPEGEDAWAPRGFHQGALVGESTSRRWQRLDRVMDWLRDKYGEDIILRGRMLAPHASSELRNERTRGTSLQKDVLDARAPVPRRSQEVE
ncbi:DNA polymerase IV [Alicyclobacillus kakegawensis]|uniref:DNA polymerase IV n=1 Tax=Alicyclobacillus kakegawensis TaxID=392012 RepID=UPI00082BC666|nr:DNA polymerase IV [Alicyclobacillus kakegawensis]